MRSHLGETAPLTGPAHFHMNSTLDRFDSILSYNSRIVIFYQTQSNILKRSLIFYQIFYILPDSFRTTVILLLNY